MPRVVCLDHNLARTVPAAGAACDLDDRLREALLALEVCPEQTLVGIENADERDARKSCPFVSICVPTMISVSPRSTSSSTAASAPRVRDTSRSSRAIRRSRETVT